MYLLKSCFTHTDFLLRNLYEIFFFFSVMRYRMLLEVLIKNLTREDSPQGQDQNSTFSFFYLI